MNKTMLGVLLAVGAVAVQASTVRDLESSAVVNGTIVLAKDGSVQAAVIDDAAKIGQPVADMVHKVALQWRFQPVLRNGEPVATKANMHVRVILKKTPEGNYTARIKGATFGDQDMKSTDMLRRVEGNKNILPSYPKAAIHYRVQGTVYLSLHVNRSGQVTEAVAQQVNLDNVGPDHVLAQYRRVLAQAALASARKWKYQVPTTGPLAHQDSWTADVPVNFSLTEMGEAKTERVWETYVPGPYTPAPWIDKPDMNATDAVANDNSVRTEGAGPTLLTQISQD
jgi:hypothetical protein